MSLDIAPLNLAGALSYALVAVLCLGVYLRKDTERGWILVSFFFVFLISSRLFGIEDILRDSLRASMRENGVYAGRHYWQVAALFLASISLVLSIFSFRRSTSFNLRNLRSRPLIVAYWACGVMVALIVVRIISLHAVDALLYGPLKVNWLFDLGCAAMVAGCALWSGLEKKPDQ